MENNYSLVINWCIQFIDKLAFLLAYSVIKSRLRPIRMEINTFPLFFNQRRYYGGENYLQMTKMMFNSYFD